MTKKIYILQKDLPNIKAGNEFIWDDLNKSYKPKKYATDSETITVFNEFYVENNPDWFELREEKKYTETQMRNCFESARLLTNCGGTAMCTVYNNFDEYLKLINE